MTAKPSQSVSVTPLRAEDDVAARRAELASLLGRLLARWWLSKHGREAGPAPQPDNGAQRSTPSRKPTRPAHGS